MSINKYRRGDGSIVFVMSQDGHFRAYTRDQNGNDRPLTPSVSRNTLDEAESELAEYAAEHKWMAIREPVETRETRLLKCVLTADEIEQRTENLIAAIDRHKAARADGKSAAAQYKSLMETAEADTDRLTNVVRDRTEYRQIQCVTTSDWETLRVITVREDTGEIVEERDMRQDERQMPLC